MDENSCEDETSKSAEKVVDGQKPKEVDDPFKLEDMKVNTELKDQKTMYQVSNRCGSSYDASVSGTSTSSSEYKETPSTAVEEVNEQSLEPNVENMAEFQQEQQEQQQQQQQQEQEQEQQQQQQQQHQQQLPQQLQLPTTNQNFINYPDSRLPPIYEAPLDSQPPVRVAPCLEDQLSTRKGSIGPPPSYSFVMKQKKKWKLLPVDPITSNRPPPPSYPGTRGLYIDDESRLERMCSLPSFGEPTWRSHSQPAYCNRCNVIVLTTTHSHDSLATHMAALALCLFGLCFLTIFVCCSCWPCCLLPYCMSICKNTYHHCPLCQSFLGAYSPW